MKQRQDAVSIQLLDADTMDSSRALQAPRPNIKRVCTNAAPVSVDRNNPGAFGDKSCLEAFWYLPCNLFEYPSVFQKRFPYNKAAFQTVSRKISVNRDFFIFHVQKGCPQPSVKISDNSSCCLLSLDSERKVSQKINWRSRKCWSLNKEPSQGFKYNKEGKVSTCLWTM